MGNLQKQEQCNPAGREPLSADIVRLAALLGERARNLVDRIDGKLSPVCCPSPIQNEENKTCGTQVCYPPLFKELFSSLSKIEWAINSIEDTLSRCEV